MTKSIAIQTTQQTDRIGSDKSTRPGLVVAVAVIVEARLGIIVLPLKTQGRLNFGQFLFPHIAISAIAHLPGGCTIFSRQRQRGTKVIQLIVEYLCALPFPFQLHQRLEATGFVDKAAVTTLAATFGNQVIGLPQELANLVALLLILPNERFANTAAKGIVVVTGDAPTWQLDSDELMLTVVVITGDK
ncbi:hypothetical protein AE1304_15400 [Aeromonas enteropelogenes]